MLSVLDYRYGNRQTGLDGVYVTILREDVSNIQEYRWLETIVDVDCLAPLQEPYHEHARDDRGNGNPFLEQHFTSQGFIQQIYKRTAEDDAVDEYEEGPGGDEG